VWNATNSSFFNALSATLDIFGKWERMEKSCFLASFFPFGFFVMIIYLRYEKMPIQL
jgi:hypothetical protein